MNLSSLFFFKILFFFFKDFIYLFIHDREREAETQSEGEAGSMQGARHGTRSQDSRITPWAKGRCQTAEPPKDPQIFFEHLLCAMLCARYWDITKYKRGVVSFGLELTDILSRFIER